MDIKEITFPATTYAAIKKEVSFDQLKDKELYGEMFSNIFAFTGLTGLELTGAPSTIYFTWDEENKKTDLAGALPISNDISSVDANQDGIEVVKLEGGKAAMAEHWGPYEKLEETHKAMWDYIGGRDDIDYGEAVVEEYVTDPGQEPDETKWLTKVYYILK